MSGEGVKLAIQLGDVHRQMRRGLGAIEKHGDSTLVRHFDDPLDRVDRPQSVRDVDRGEQLGALGHEFFELFQNNVATIVDRRHHQLRALFFAKHLPRNDVRVVLHGGDEDFVAFAHMLAAIGRGDQIDGLGRTAHEDDFAGITGTHKVRHVAPRVLIGHGCLSRKVVHAAVHVGVGLAVAASLGLDHHLRLLRRGRTVQVDQQLAIRRQRQRREVPANRLDVERRLVDLRLR